LRPLHDLPKFRARRNRPNAAAAQPMGWIIWELGKNLIKREISSCGNLARPSGRAVCDAATID
jgi:hypothetical protein